MPASSLNRSRLSASLKNGPSGGGTFFRVPDRFFQLISQRRHFVQLGHPGGPYALKLPV